MPDRAVLLQCLNALQRALQRPLTEDEVERLFQPIFDVLGYTTPGGDLRGKRRGETGVPDVVLLDADGSFNTVVELKNPTEHLEDHERQIRDYLGELRPTWGLLSNGRDFWFYTGRQRLLPIADRRTLEELLIDPAPLLRLAKRTYDFEDLPTIRARVHDLLGYALRPATLTDTASRFFLEAFSLEPESPFSQLVASLFNLSMALNAPSRFFGGSFSFWRKFHARELSLEDAPERWLAYLPARSEAHLYRFMFVLETAYVITARLILAKAVQDSQAFRLMTPVRRVYSAEVKPLRLEIGPFLTTK